MNDLNIDKMIQDKYWNQISSYKIIDAITIGFAEKYESELDWQAISENDCVNWTLEFIKRFKEKLNFSMFTEQMYYVFSERKFLFELCHQFPKKVNWDFVSLNIKSSSQIEQIKEYVKWEVVSKNQSIDWSPTDLHTYKKLIDWGIFCCHCNNASFIDESEFTIELLIQDFEDCICWNSLSKNERIRWNCNKIKQWQDKLNWQLLVINSSVNWTPNSLILFERFVAPFYKEKWFRTSHLWQTLVYYKFEHIKHQTKQLHRRTEIDKITEQLLDLL